MAAKNTLAHKRSKIDINRIRRAVRTVGSRAGKNSELLELMGLMAIPKLIGGVVSNQINELVVVEDVVTTDENGVAIVTKVEKTLEVVDQQNDLLSSLAPSIPDLTALVGRYTKANKMVLVGGAVLLTALFGNKAIQRSSR